MALYATKRPDRFISAVSYDGAMHERGETAELDSPYFFAEQSRDQIANNVSLMMLVGGESPGCLQSDDEDEVCALTDPSMLDCEWLGPAERVRPRPVGA